MAVLTVPAAAVPRGVGPTGGEVLSAVRAMLEGGPALSLGAAGAGPEVPDGTGVVVTTSGSTGVPKSVVLSRAALLAGARATAARIGQGPWLLALPPGYVAGLQVIVRSVLAGAEPVLLTGHFDPARFAAAALRMPEGGYTSLVPAQLARLLDAAAADRTVAAALRRFRAVLVGGQALPAPLRDRARRAGVRIVRTYGATETCGGCVYDGRPLDGVRVRIAGEEVQLAGPMLADGYLGDPDRTAAAFVTGEDGRWYRTGDIGRVEAGVLSVTGRVDNVIVSGGLNVSLDRVEQIVRTVPGLGRAVVVGVADPRWGEASVVVVPGDAPDDGIASDAARTAPDVRAGDAGLLEAARRAVAAVLGPPARPARLVVVDGPLLLPSGKPDRARLRRLAQPRAAGR